MDERHNGDIRVHSHACKKNLPLAKVLWNVFKTYLLCCKPKGKTMRSWQLETVGDRRIGEHGLDLRLALGTGLCIGLLVASHIFVGRLEVPWVAQGLANWTWAGGDEGKWRDTPVGMLIFLFKPFYSFSPLLSIDPVWGWRCSQWTGRETGEGPVS